MKKFILGAVAALFLLAMSLYTPDEAGAVPAFARQTGMACNTCHFQHYPLLNAFGRNFEANGFTMVGGQSLVEGDVLSMPSVLNASLVTKIRYQKTNGDTDDSGTNKGELQFPDEAALLIGGRVGEHIGFVLEAQMADSSSPMFASFKMPIGFDVGESHLSVIPFRTDAFGPQSSFELLNTGAVRHIRVLENRTDISAVQYVGAQREAQGLGFVAYHNTGYINYTLWQPHAGTSDAGPLHYVRIAATPTVAGWDLGGGVQWWGGTSVDGSKTRNKAEAWALDAQAQGLVGNLPLGVYLQYASAGKSDAGEPSNFFNSNARDEKAFSILAELGVIPNRATVAVGYRDGDNGDSANNEQNSITLGATYLVTQNVELQANHSIRSGDFYDLPANNENANGDQLTTLMIFSAF
jgi:hypothetical protein